MASGLRCAARRPRTATTNSTGCSPPSRGTAVRSSAAAPAWTPAASPKTCSSTGRDAPQWKNSPTTHSKPTRRSSSSLAKEYVMTTRNLATRAQPRLGLQENAGQFVLLVVVNALVGGMVGQQQTTLPLLAEQEFGLTGYAFIFS